MSFLMNPYRYASASVIDTTELAAYYKMDGNALDSSGNGYNLNNSGVVFSSDAKFDESASIYLGGSNPASSNNRLTISSCPIESTDANSTKGWSVSAWVNFRYIPIGSIVSEIFGMRAPGERTIELRYINDNYQFVTYAGAGYTSTYTWKNTPQTNKWIHVCLVQQPLSGVMELFVDNVKVISITDTLSRNYTPSSSFSIGNHPTQTRAFTGRIDEMSFWNRPLTPVEIGKLYNATSPLIS